MCNHKNTVLSTTGSVRMVAGDIVDDVEDRVLCLDCGEYIEDEPGETEEVEWIEF